MKITIEHKETKIIVEESEQNDERTVTMKYKDQNEQIKNSIIVMCEQVQKLQNSTNQ